MVPLVAVILIPVPLSLALKKIAALKSIPYQTLIRQWLAEGMRKELHLTSR